MRRSVLALSLLALARPAAGQLHAVRLIVPFTPGGTTDTVARLVAPGLAAELGRPVLVENRPGAAGLLGAEAVARAPADGLTLGLSTAAAHGTIPLAQAQAPYDGARDFTHIALLGETPTVLLVPAGSRFHSFAELLGAARTWRQGLTFASPGAGSLPHLQGEMLARIAGARLTHVPYRGTAPALEDLLAGRVDCLFAPLAGTLPAIRAGQARALAVSSAASFPALPGVPTWTALGFTGLTATAWTGLCGPRGLAPAFVTRVNAALARIVAEPEVKLRLEAAGLYPPASPPDPAGVQRLVAEFTAAWGPAVRAAGVTASAN